MLDGLSRARGKSMRGEAPPLASVLSIAGLGDAPLATRRASNAFERIDVPLILVVLALALLGMVMVYSASISLTDSARYNVTTTHFLVRHVLALTVAIGCGVLAFATPLQTWQRLAPIVFVIGMVALAIVLIPGIGKGVNGARRWVPLGFVNLQPSELMKIACVLYAASFTVRKQEYMQDFRKGFAPMAGVISVLALLLLWQPDLGAFGVLVTISMGVLFLGGVNGRVFAGISVTLAAAFSLVIWLSPWRRARIFAYIDPCAPEQALSKGYQLCTSLISFGRGEIFGVGLGGSVVKLSYLPEAHTDFIFAVIGEELGLIGVLVVMVLFYWLTKRAFEIGRQAIAIERTFAGLVAQGIGIWIGVQSFINMGVATGLLPTKGLTLPLVSYGGSALLSTMTALGILLRVDFENRQLMRGGRQ